MQIPSPLFEDHRIWTIVAMLNRAEHHFGVASHKWCGIGLVHPSLWQNYSRRGLLEVLGS